MSPGQLPVDQRVPHARGDGGRLRGVTESEDALDDGQLGARGVQAAERTPVIDHHPGRDHLAAPVHCAGLDRKLTLTLRHVQNLTQLHVKDWASRRSSDAAVTHHQRNLQQRRQLVLVFYRRLRVDEAALVAEGAV